MGELLERCPADVQNPTKCGESFVVACWANELEVRSANETRCREVEHIGRECASKEKEGKIELAEGLSNGRVQDVRLQPSQY